MKRAAQAIHHTPHSIMYKMSFFIRA